MLRKIEKTQYLNSASAWHYKEVALRTRYSPRYVRMVLFEKKRTNYIVEREYARVVSESKNRQIELTKLLHAQSN